jgi:hypothetical protein
MKQRIRFVIGAAFSTSASTLTQSTSSYKSLGADYYSFF